MDYTQFKKDRDDILCEAIHRCKCEMYKRAQPSVDYDKLAKAYNENKIHFKRSYYEYFYLSHEEFKYIVKKYADLYKLNSGFQEHCDLLIDNMKKGSIKDKYVKAYDDESGHHPPYRGYEDIPPIKENIGDEAANFIIDYIEGRKEFYRTEHELDSFSTSIYLTDTPMSCEKTTQKAWRDEGFTIELDPRHYDENYFYDEEHGYLEDEES